MRDEDSSDPPKLVQMVPPSPLDSPPPSVVMEVAFGALSRQGPGRSVNDDHYLIMRLGRHMEMLKTSLPAGDLASRLAIATLVQLAIDFGKWHVRVNELIADEMMDRAARYYRSVDSILQKASQRFPGVLQTTMTAVYTAGSELFFAHVGHSRAYLFRDDRLMQLTRDHTLDRERPGTATIVDVSASAQDQRHIVTETLGVAGAGPLRVDVERCGLVDGDVVLLSTNGLTDVADDARIAEALRLPGTPDDRCRALVGLAASSGATDDATVLVAHYRIRAPVGDAEAGTNH